MLRERYERMLKKFGPDAPGTINAKRQLDEQMKAMSGARAVNQDKVDQKLIVQFVPKAPAPKGGTRSTGPVSDELDQEASSGDPQP